MPADPDITLRPSRPEWPEPPC